MDNGNKIKINKPEVKLFLHGDLLPDNFEVPVKYDLTEEYAKTRSRRPSFAIIVLFLCVAAVTLLTMGLVSFLQDRNNNLEIDIEVFEDLNLKNLLDVVSRTQASLDQVLQEKNQLELEYSTKLDQVRLRRDSELQLLESLKMDDAQRESETQRIGEEYTVSASALYSEYQPQISLLEGQMDDYTKQLASFNSSNVELAQEQESVLNSQRQAFELEKQELVASYDKLVEDLVNELESLQSMQLETQKTALTTLSTQHAAELYALDPIFTDQRAINTVNQYDGTVSTVDFTGGNYRIIVEDQNTQAGIDKMLEEANTEYAEFNHVSGIISSVPWQNSLSEYVEALTNMANRVGEDIVRANSVIIRQQENALIKSKEALLLKEQELTQILSENEINEKQLDELQLRLQELQSELAIIQERAVGYQDIINAFDERAKKNGDAGYILNIDDKRNIAVYISPLFIDYVQNGTKAFVHRAEGALVGEITLYKNGNVFYAVENAGAIEDIQVNDILVLELVQ